MTPADPLKWASTKAEEEARLRQGIGDSLYDSFPRWTFEGRKENPMEFPRRSDGSIDLVRAFRTKHEITDPLPTDAERFLKRTEGYHLIRSGEGAAIALAVADDMLRGREGGEG